jgi:putative transposase
MDVPVLLNEAQMRQIEAFFSLSHGIPRVDDRRIVSGIIYVIKHGLMWRDAPVGYGPHKTIYNRFIRWSRLGVFNRIFTELAGKAGEPERIMIENVFGRIKYWRRLAKRYDRCTHTFMSAISIPATCCYWLSSINPEPNADPYSR